MPYTTDTTPAPIPACPSWCQEHRELDHDRGAWQHSRDVIVGDMTVTVALVNGTYVPGDADPTGTYVYVPECEWIDGDSILNLASALREAHVIANPPIGDDAEQKTDRMVEVLRRRLADAGIEPAAIGVELGPDLTVSEIVAASKALDVRVSDLFVEADVR